MDASPSHEEFHRGQGQADLPAEQSSSCTRARFPVAHAHACGPFDRQQPPQQGPREAHGLIVEHDPRRVRSHRRPGANVVGGDWSMTAASHRISRRSDFSRTLKRGVRISAHDVVVHLLVTPREWPDAAGRRVDVATTGGPWLGLIVSKAVGSAVTRHRVARRLRSASPRLFPKS